MCLPSFLPPPSLFPLLLTFHYSLVLLPPAARAHAHQGRSGALDEDDDEEDGAGRQGVQCAQQ
jgi:hypothetical protein